MGIAVSADCRVKLKEREKKTKKNDKYQDNAREQKIYGISK